jgi:hypothetical protein
MKNPEAFIAKVNAVKPGNYCATGGELHAIMVATNENLFDSMYMAFQYGFLRGQNAEKNRRKKK